MESPVCVVGHYREITIPALPTDVTLQLDHRIEIRSTTANPAGSKLLIARLNTLEDRPAVFRFGGITGPILGILPLKAMRVRSAGQTANFVSAALGNNTWDVAIPVVVDGNYQGTSIT